MEEDLREHIKNLYLSGRSIREIASQLNMSYSTVRKILKDSKIQFRGRISYETINEIIELAKQGYSANKISKLKKLNINTVLRILKKYKLVKTKRKLSSEDIEKIKNMYLNGESIYRIAKLLNISTNLVVYHLKKLNIYKNYS